MVKKGDTFKDMLAYLHWRKKHLILERKKVPYIVKEEHRIRIYDKLSAKIRELQYTETAVHGCIKDMSKLECLKVSRLEKVKVENESN